jgi:hypothetical protein
VQTPKRHAKNNVHDEGDTDGLLRDLKQILGLEDGPHIERDWNEARDIEAGFQFREFINDRAPLHACCVCGKYCGKIEVSWYTPQQIRYLNVLLASIHSTDIQPRLGLTTTWLDVDGVRKEYCLLSEPDAKCIREENGSVELQVCTKCHDNLGKQRVPRDSYVYIDPGLRPPGLPKLWMLEQCCLASIRRNNFLFIIKGGLQGTEVSFARTRGHVVAFPHTSPNDIIQALPVDPTTELPKFIRVCFIGVHAKDKQDLRALAGTTKCLHVRGAVINMWARHLAAMYKKYNVGFEYPLNEDCMKAYAELNGVPPSLVDTAIHATNEETAKAAMMASQVDREGAASAR